MQTPEVLLLNFNKTLEILLKSSIILEDYEIEENLIRIYKKTYLSQVFFNKYIIAVSGLQGVGKTTFLKNLYDLDDNILEPNIGRGEKIPVLFSENESIQKPTFSLTYFEKIEQKTFINEIELSNNEFNKKAKNPNDRDLYLEIKLPYKLLNNSTASFALLPGFESSNEEFQNILFHSLISSASCIFVLDEMRFADYRNKNYLNLIMEKFSSANPIFILTRADQSEDDNQELLENFKRQYANIEDDRIIIFGIGKEYKEKYLPKLNDALLKYVNNNFNFRKVQLEQLNKIIIESRPILDKIEEKLLNLKIENDFRNYEVENYLKVLREKIESLRKDFSKKLSSNLNTKGGEAKDKIEAHLYKKNWLDIIKDIFILRRKFKVRKELEDIIKKIWNEVDSNNISLNNSIEDILLLNGLLIMESKNKNSTENDKLIKYNESYILMEGEKDIDSFKKDCSLLFTNKKFEEVNFSNNFKNNLEKMPILFLELLRILNYNSKNLKVDSKKIVQVPSEKGNSILEDFTNLKDNHSTIIKGIGVILGLDAAYDGKLDSIPNLITALTLTTNQATLATQIGTGIGILFAVGYLYKSLLNQIDKSDIRNLEDSKYFINQITDHLYGKYMELFDDLMNLLYNKVKESLENRYNLSKEFSRKESLVKALSDFKDKRTELRQFLVSSK
jgi:hypothetical protein